MTSEWTLGLFWRGGVCQSPSGPSKGQRKDKVGKWQGPMEEGAKSHCPLSEMGAFQGLGEEAVSHPCLQCIIQEAVEEIVGGWVPRREPC